jgi:hypothetical protein
VDSRKKYPLVATAMGMAAESMSHQEILVVFPDLEGENIRQALPYANGAGRNPSDSLRKILSSLDNSAINI